MTQILSELLAYWPYIVGVSVFVVGWVSGILQSVISSLITDKLKSVLPWFSSGESSSSQQKQKQTADVDDSSGFSETDAEQKQGQDTTGNTQDQSINISNEGEYSGSISQSQAQDEGSRDSDEDDLMTDGGAVVQAAGLFGGSDDDSEPGSDQAQNTQRQDTTVDTDVNVDLGEGGPSTSDSPDELGWYTSDQFEFYPEPSRNGSFVNAEAKSQGEFPVYNTSGEAQVVVDHSPGVDEHWICVQTPPNFDVELFGNVRADIDNENELPRFKPRCGVQSFEVGISLYTEAEQINHTMTLLPEDNSRFSPTGGYYVSYSIAEW